MFSEIVWLLGNICNLHTGVPRAWLPGVYMFGSRGCIMGCALGMPISHGILHGWQGNG